MGEYRILESGDGRPVFTSNEIKVLFASGCSTQVSLLEPEVLRAKFDAELLLDNVKLDPYFQIGECIGGIYRLGHFPLDGSDYDYKGLLVFNTVPSEEYKKSCTEPDLIAPVGAICDMIVGAGLFGNWSRDEVGYRVEIPDDMDRAIVKANKLLQAMID